MKKSPNLCILGGPGSYTINREIPAAWYIRVNRRVYDTREEAEEAKRRIEGKHEGRELSALETTPTLGLREEAQMETRRYVNSLGNTIFVSSGLGGELWGTFWRKPSGALRRICSPSTPMRATQAEAQADLDAYAQKHGLKEA